MVAVEYIGPMKLSKLKLIGLFAFISVSAFASWDEEQTPESERQMGSFHNEQSRKPKKKDECERWMNMPALEKNNSELQPLPIVEMDFSRPKLKQLGEESDPSESQQMQ